MFSKEASKSYVQVKSVTQHILRVCQCIFAKQYFETFITNFEGSSEFITSNKINNHQ